MYELGFGSRRPFVRSATGRSSEPPSRVHAGQLTRQQRQHYQYYKQPFHTFLDILTLNVHSNEQPVQPTCDLAFQPATNTFLLRSGRGRSSKPPRAASTHARVTDRLLYMHASKWPIIGSISADKG